VQFDRFARIDIGLPGTQGVRIDRLRIAFEVVKTNLPQANELTISIWNMAPETRAQVERRENTVILSAGYNMDIIKTLAVGDVSAYDTKMDGQGDLVTTLICGDGVRALRDTRVNLSYAGEVSAQQIVNDLARALSLESVDVIANLSGAYRNGYSYSGRAAGSLDELASRFSFEWSVQNGELKILTRRTADTRDVVVLTPQTGLIGSPAPLDDVGTSMAQNAQEPGLAIECQLQPRIYPSGVVELQSRDYRGRYRVETVIHRGDTRGNDWRSELQVREL
jgi:hypothetical protein